MRRLAPAVLALVLALAACGGDGGTRAKNPAAAGGAPLRIGTKNFVESEILGELYKQAIEAKGVKVDLQSGVGSTEVTNAALRDGLLDMYPEYIGVLLAEVDKIHKRPADPRAAYLLAKKEERRRHFTLLAQTRLSNENALAVTRVFALRRHVRSIADLEHLRPPARLGAAPEFSNRFEGLLGLRSRYRLTSLKVKDVDTNKGLQYPQLDDGEIDVASVYTTDRQLAGGRYTLLDDPRGVFATQHLAPLISDKALAQHGPLLATTLDAVSALLTTLVMQRLNAQAATRSPREVAAAFLRAHGLQAASAR